MAKIALVETTPSSTDYHRWFDFEFDRYSLSTAKKKKILKSDVDIDIDTDEYDFLILIGSEPFKYFTKKTSITAENGRLINDKYLPVINPAMITFRPEAKKAFEEAVQNIKDYISGDLKVHEIPEEFKIGIENTQEAYVFLTSALVSDSEYVSLDCETSALSPRDGYMIGFSLSYEHNGKQQGAYISTDCIDKQCEGYMQQIFEKKIVVFHNAKFDLQWFEYHFNFTFPRFEDTMLQHYLLDEQPGTHGLKTLAMKHTDYGEYEQTLYEWIDNYRKQHGILKDDFSWDLVPFEVMKDYAAMDAVVTLALFHKFKKALDTNDRLTWVYRNILLPGCRFLCDIETNGVPFDTDRLKRSSTLMAEQIDEAVSKLNSYPEVQQFIKDRGEFNPNSTVQLRSLLFDYIGLEPTGKKTGTGADSTDAEVLGQLGEQHEIPKLILEVRQNVKIKNTYLDKILPALDLDGRLRTGFNLHGTTSGRLSSSGKLNMQQIPRDNPIVKGCIKAKEGHQIVAMDLTTAEVYCAAVLAKDENLMDVFRQGGNFHSTIAKQVFKLPCEVEEVAELYGDKRQQAKAVTFGIMYGAGPQKISWQVTKDSGKEFSVGEAQRVIAQYFEMFSNLKQWLTHNQQFIRDNAFIYSFFGRKRRLPNVTSKDKGIASHEVRSGINFLVQSVASDVNLLAAIEMNQWIKKVNMPARIFALVHDSILAEVPDEHVEEYCAKLQECVQRERGVNIPNAPIGCDFEVGEDYSMGKFVAKYEV